MATTRAKSPFELSRGVERRYAATLRKLAAKIGALVNGYENPIDDPAAVDPITNALNAYAAQITPWARSVSARIVAEIDFQNRRAYAAHSQRMSRALKRELDTAPTGEMMRFMMAEQVELIRSLPLEAAKRVHELAIKGIIQGHRASALSKMIQQTGEVTKARANLIARTETARTSSNLTMARAVYVGSADYTWQTARDEDVRPSHRGMQSKVVAWSSPPTLDGLTGHAGCLPNCRCYPEPIIPE